ncbi:long-chain fatty acid--CoA ligase [Aeromicrobium sp. CTD01-1L150]|uniref:acyl-CoA synthetase n=1 Tax=Aeromicrobium sp. CTD01-1L150 TaxID=3341830 RepID=UPI0035C04FF6
MSENLNAPLERAALLHGDRIAVVDGDRRWTYRQLRDQVAAFDAGLDRLGLEQGDVVGLLALNSAEHLMAWLGVPRSGRVLNDLNVRLAPSEMAFILDDSKTRVLIVDDAFVEVGRQLAEAAQTPLQLVHAGTAPQPSEGLLTFAELCAEPGETARGVDPDAAAGLFYTGGTTGFPKGVILTHRSLVHNAKNTLIALGYTTEDSYLHAAPMFHLADGASTYALTWIGGTHVMLPAFEPGAWLSAMSEHRVTRALLVPTMVNMVVHHPDVQTHDMSALRSILYGASPMPSELLRLAMEQFPCDWYQGYGMTEGSPLVAVLGPAEHRAAVSGRGEDARLLESAGRPIVGVEVEVRRADGASVCKPEEPGELYARGPNFMREYWNRPQESEQALREGWYRSGDAAIMDDKGYLYIIDRVKDMIVSGGENVYCSEVENAIYQHPEVHECAVFGVPDERWGERVHAAVVPRTDDALTEEDLIAHCRPRIANYKLPRSFEFHDALPKSGAGKVLKRELRAPHWEGQNRGVS